MWRIGGTGAFSAKAGTGFVERKCEISNHEHSFAVFNAASLTNPNGKCVAICDRKMHPATQAMPHIGECASPA
jgi:hypothetical protein